MARRRSWRFSEKPEKTCHHTLCERNFAVEPRVCLRGYAVSNRPL